MILFYIVFHIYPAFGIKSHIIFFLWFLFDKPKNYLNQSEKFHMKSLSNLFPYRTYKTIYYIFTNISFPVLYVFISLFCNKVVHLFSIVSHLFLPYAYIWSMRPKFFSFWSYHLYNSRKCFIRFFMWYTKFKYHTASRRRSLGIKNLI